MKRALSIQSAVALLSASTLLALTGAVLGADEYRFAGQWGKRGTGDGQFMQPVAVAIGGSNTVYVVDQGNRRVQKFSGDGIFLSAWGAHAERNVHGDVGAGDTAGQFRVPSGVACDDEGRVYVADWGKHRVQAFDAAGVFLRTWGGQGKDAGLFAFPTGIAAGRGRFVYVADQDNGRVQKFREDGAFVTQFLQTGCSPHGLAVGPGGNVYAIDTRGRYWVFTAEGALVGWRGRGTRVEDGAVRRTGWFAPEETFSYQKQQGFWVETGPFDGDGEFFEPRGIAVDAHGNVFVADTRNHRIQKFAPDGAFLCKWGTRGTGAGQFDFPYGLAVDAAGNVYVADKYNHRIQKFVPVTVEGKPSDLRR